MCQVHYIFILILPKTLMVLRRSVHWSSYCIKQAIGKTKGIVWLLKCVTHRTSHRHFHIYCVYEEKYQKTHSYRIFASLNFISNGVMEMNQHWSIVIVFLKKNCRFLFELLKNLEILKNLVSWQRTIPTRIKTWKIVWRIVLEVENSLFI